MDFFNHLDPEVLFPALTLCASGLANLLVLFGNLFVFLARLVSDYRRDKEKHDAENRIAAVRADPASAWLRKLGGTDKRSPASSPDDARSDRHP